MTTAERAGDRPLVAAVGEHEVERMKRLEQEQKARWGQSTLRHMAWLDMKRGARLIWKWVTNG